MTSPCPSVGSSSQAWGATSHCTRSRSTPNSRRRGSICPSPHGAAQGLVSAATLTCIASAPRGFTDLLARELSTLGALQVREQPGGVAFTGGLETLYAACLWSRIANRVFLELAQFRAEDAAEFYAAV